MNLSINTKWFQSQGPIKECKVEMQTCIDADPRKFSLENQHLYEYVLTLNELTKTLRIWLMVNPLA